MGQTLELIRLALVSAALIAMAASGRTASKNNFQKVSKIHRSINLSIQFDPGNDRRGAACATRQMGNTLYRTHRGPGYLIALMRSKSTL